MIINKLHFWHTGLLAILFLTLPLQAAVLYDFVGKQDTSYANVKRGTLRIRIQGNQVPSEAELQQIAVSAWTAYRDWPNGSLFIYVKDMPTNSAAYAIAEFERSQLKKFTINHSALEAHEYFKQRQ